MRLSLYTRVSRSSGLLLFALACSRIAAAPAIDGVKSGDEASASTGSRGQNAGNPSSPRTSEETDPDQNVVSRETVRFRFSGLSQEAQVEIPVSFQIEAIDDLGELDPNYVGTVVFDSSDVGAVRPGATFFSSADQGRLDFPDGLVFRNPGTHWVFVRDPNQPTTFGQGSVQVNDSRLGHFYISASRGDDGGSVPGSFASPWRSVQSSVNRVPAGSVLHILRGTYIEHVVLDKVLQLLGESASRCTISGGGNGSPVRVRRGGSGSILSHLTMTGSGSLPLDAGVDIYGDTVTVSNNLIVGNQHGVRVNLASGVQILNNTIADNRGDALVLRTSTVTFDRNIVAGVGGCAGYAYLAPDQLGAVEYNLFWDFGAKTCPDTVDPPTNLVAAPDFFGRFFISAGSPAFDSGPSDAAFHDVDGSANDRGAYGGPRGEFHSPFVTADQRSSLGLGLGGIALAWARHRRSRKRAQGLRSVSGACNHERRERNAARNERRRVGAAMNACDPSTTR